MRPLDSIVQREWFASVEQNNAVYTMNIGSGPLAQSHFTLGLH